MVDYQSKYRLYSSGYTTIVPRISVPNCRELNHEAGRQVFSARKFRPVHDCRADVMKNHTQLETWDVWLLAHGLRSSYNESVALHEKQESDSPSSKKSLDKLLYKVGLRGSANGDFDYPRGVCTTLECDILVADSQNHRIQILNQFGVYKKSFGKLGSGPGEFDEPTDVVELPNGEIAVTDRHNRRVQVFSEDAEFKLEFPVSGEPFSLACDRSYNLTVSTVNRTVELFSGRDFKHVRRFTIPARLRIARRVENCPVPVCVNESNEIIVSDPVDMCIKVFSFHGRMLRQFKPQAHANGLAITPGGIYVTVLGQILVADTLNHVVNAYTDTGVFLKHVVGPTDDVGCLHSLTVGPEGHLVITECSVTGEHCVKILRYRGCPCHQDKVPSSKKRTPATSPN